MANKDTVKQWFETGDFPTQTQFYQKFDWQRWKDEKIAADDLTPELLALINAISGRPERKVMLTDGAFDMVAEYKLCGIAAKNTSANDVVLAINYPGYTPDIPGTNWVELEVPAGETAEVQIDHTFWAATTLSVTGITGVVLDAMPIILLIDRK